MGFFWEKLARPLAFRVDAEHAHELGIKALKLGFASPYYCDNTAFGFGEIERFGLKFPNPIGIAAGFDKNGVVVDELASLGFGFVEVGTVTYEPQSGNPKPRLFRLPKDEALINRLGFNNEGAAVVAERLSKVRRRCVVGVNIGRNKDVANDEASTNYGAVLEAVWSAADYIVVNVSSPNTLGLRELQGKGSLRELLSYLQERNSVHGAVADILNPEASTEPDPRGAAGKPLLVKVTSDVGDDELESAVDTCMSLRLAGIIAVNTTVSRVNLTTHASEYGEGGLSGRPLAARSNEVISTIYRQTKGKLPIIGVGGVFSAQDAFEKIAAGSSLVQAYTGFVYGGPCFAADVNRGLAKILKERGFNSLDEAVGSSVKAS